jgi:FixJ family two-component response regulator
LRSNDRSHLAGLHPVNSLLVAIIDDDEALCASLVDLMRSVGYRAKAFASAETFLASSNLVLFDCVIADVDMPGMSGLDLVRKLREQGGVIPIFLITALPDKRLHDEAISVGAQCLLKKPFETGALLDCVERSLSNERPPR